MERDTVRFLTFRTSIMNGLVQKPEVGGQKKQGSKDVSRKGAKVQRESSKLKDKGKRIKVKGQRRKERSKKARSADSTD